MIGLPPGQNGGWGARAFLSRLFFAADSVISVRLMMESLIATVIADFKAS